MLLNQNQISLGGFCALKAAPADLHCRGNPEKRFQDLKNGPLWHSKDDAQGYFLYHRDPLDPQDLFRGCFFNIQALSVLVQVELGSFSAWKSLEELQASSIWQKDVEFWLNDDYDLAARTRNDRPEDVLCAAWLLSCFQPEVGRHVFEKFKQSRYYDGESGLWHFGPGNPKFGSANQLLSIMIELELDPDKAKTSYARLKETPLWSESLQGWHAYFEDKSSPRVCRLPKPDFKAGLLDILYHCRVDIPRARGAYSTLLKDGKLQEDTLNWSRDENDSEQALHAEPEFLSIMIESRLLRSRAESELTSQRLPAVRRF